jgi:hypothetical protein
MDVFSAPNCPHFQINFFSSLFLLATRHRDSGLNSELTESNLPPTHIVARLNLKGKRHKTPYPQTIVPINWGMRLNRHSERCALGDNPRAQFAFKDSMIH